MWPAEEEGALMVNGGPGGSLKKIWTLNNNDTRYVPVFLLFVVVEVFVVVKTTNKHNQPTDKRTSSNIDWIFTFGVLS